MLLAAVVWSIDPCAVLAATPTQATFIQVLFGDLPPSDGDDANGDGALTVADLLLLPPGDSTTPTPGSTRTATATPAGTATAGPPASPTPTGTATPSPTRTATPAPTPTATITATPAPTATATASPTPEGLLFAGTISDLVPHAVGDTLVYKVTDPAGNFTTVTTIVTSSEPSGVFDVNDKQVAPNGKVMRDFTHSYTDTGRELFYRGRAYEAEKRTITLTCDPPLWRLETPVIADQRRTTINSYCQACQEGVPTCGELYVTETFTPVAKLPSVTVGDLTFTQVIHFTGSTATGSKPGVPDEVEHTEVYLAPGVGPILRLSTFSGNQTYRYELVDGVIGGMPVKQ